jgi:hypothetical protein
LLTVNTSGRDMRTSFLLNLYSTVYPSLYIEHSQRSPNVCMLVTNARNKSL